MANAERAAYIFSYAVEAQIEMEAMKAANHERRMKDQSDAYGPEDFWNLHNKLKQRTSELY